MKEQDPGKLISFQKEAEHWNSKASKLVKKHKLLNRLGIVDRRDSYIFNEYLVIRLVRERVYEASRLLSSPLTPTLERMPIVRGWVKRLDYLANFSKELLQSMETSTNSFVQELPTEEHRRKARIIEMAANDLIARETTSNTKTQHSEPKLTPDLLNAWEQNWRSKIE